MSASIIFGLAVSLVFTLAALSRNGALQKLALVLVLSWSASNFVVKALGFGHASLILPSMDAVLCILTAALYVQTRNKTALAVMALFVIAGGAHVWAFASSATSGRNYFALMNAIFAAQLLAAGGSSAEVIRRAWIDRRLERSFAGSLLSLVGLA
jgi:hypothetical protein